MKRDLQNDGLDDFIRNAFDGYEESPSESVWTGVQSGLTSGGILSGIWGGKFWISAAATIVVGMFVGQHLYFQNKVESLTEDLEEKSIELREKVHELKNVIEAKKNEEDTGINESNLTLNANDGAKVKQELNSESSKLNDQRKIPFVKRETYVKTPEKSQINSKNGSNQVADYQQKLKENIETNSLNKTDISLSELENNKSSIRNENLLDRIEIINLNQIDFRRNENIVIRGSVKQIIPNQYAKNRFYVGLNGGLYTTKEKIKNLKPPKGGSGGNGDDCDFRDLRNGDVSFQMYGLTFGFEGRKGFGVESGVNFRQYESTSNHSVEFKYDKIDHHGGAHNFQEFDYRLITSVGDVDGEIFFKDIDPDNDLPKQEKIEFRIQTSQKQKYLSFPLLVTYHAGKGPLNLKLKTGVLANFLMDKKFDVTNAFSSHSKFEFVKQNDWGGEFQDIVPVTFDLIFGLGLEYNLNDYFSLAVEPTFISTLSPLHNETDIKSSNKSLGINAALIYSF